MYGRTLSLYSLGKTFCCTGWRIGYVVAPFELAAPLIASHAAMNFCAPTPLQKAAAIAIRRADEVGYYDWLAGVLKAKRDALVAVLREVGLAPMEPDGGYFVLFDAAVVLEAAGIQEPEGLGPQTMLDERPDVKACMWLTEHVGVTAIPVSPFYLPEDRHLENRLIRFAFCKDEATMSLAS